MMPLWTSAELAAACNGNASHAFDVESVHIDSRDAEPGALFVALKGEATDGHRYLGAAMDKGAHAVLVHDVSALPSADTPHIKVADTFDALESIARVSRDRVTGKVIGVTGSAGKTGVKEALRLSLDRYCPGEVHASIRSFNNHIGVPLTLARMRRESRFAVLEMGMNHSGELTRLSALAQPDAVAITTVASAHREFFSSEEAIADAKGEICSGLRPGGTVVLNADNRHYARLRSIAERSAAGRIVRFGWREDAEVRALSVEMQPLCSTIIADVHGERMMFKINQPGEHWVLNALCVLALVQAVDGDLGLAGLALAEMGGLDGRGARHVIERPDGGTALLLDESYNANPASMAAALSVLGRMVPERSGRRIAVLADMKELGDESRALHAALAAPVEAASAGILILVGSEMAVLADALKDITRVELADTAEAATTLLRSLLRADDIVLVKGSNSMGLGGLVAAMRSAASGGK